MLERWACKLADSFVARGANPEERDIYAYAIECLISSIVCYGLLLIVSAVIGSFPEMLVWLLFWIPLRTNFGWPGVCIFGLAALAVAMVNHLAYRSRQIKPALSK